MTVIFRAGLCLVLLSGLLVACAGGAQTEVPTPLPGTLTLSTNAIGADGTIPARYSCEGADTNPSVRWQGAPDGTISLALIVSDPDAPGGTFYHWAAYNISPAQTEIPEDLPAGDPLPFAQAENDFGKTQWNGPCPPKGSEHRYYFNLYALDIDLDPANLKTARDVEAALQEHVLAQAQGMGRFRR